MRITSPPATAAGELPADRSVHGFDIARRWCQAGTDCPDRLVGDHCVRGRAAFWHRAGKLALDDLEGQISGAFAGRLTNADDGRQACTVGCRRLAGDIRAQFMVVGTALGMADDNRRRAGITQHFCRDVAGMGAAFGHVAVLGADLDLAVGGCCQGTDQRRRRADHDVGMRCLLSRAGSDRFGLGQGGSQNRSFFQLPATSGLMVLILIPHACCSVSDHIATAR